MGGGGEFDSFVFVLVFGVFYLFSRKTILKWILQRKRETEKRSENAAAFFQRNNDRKQNQSWKDGEEREHKVRDEGMRMSACGCVCESVCASAIWGETEEGESDREEEECVHVRAFKGSQWEVNAQKTFSTNFFLSHFSRPLTLSLLLFLSLFQTHTHTRTRNHLHPHFYLPLSVFLDLRFEL